MHKDISGVLTVSTCLLNRDRNSVSDFTQTSLPPSLPRRATCVLLYLASSPRACDRTTDAPQEKKKKKKNPKKSCTFSETSASSRLAGTAARLFSLCTRNIGYPHFEINNTYFMLLLFYSSRDVGKGNGASVKLASKLLKSQEVMCFGFFSFFSFLF